MSKKMLSGANTKIKYYIMLAAVVFLWGIDPIVNSYLYNWYSAAVLSALYTGVSFIMFLIICRKRLCLINKKLLAVVLPISVIDSSACLFQKIGLQYTTPANYAFLEHLSCFSVPIILFLLFKVKTGALRWSASFICLVGCFVLTGGIDSVFGVGELLCFAAGMLLGVSMVLTERRAEGVDIYLFMLIHMFVYFLMSASFALGMNFIKSGDAALEPIRFSFEPPALIFAILFGLLAVGVCWCMRVESTRNTSAVAVAVISPFSAVITGGISIVLGTDKLTPSFVIAAALILSAAIISGLADAVSGWCDRAKGKSEEKAE